MALSSPARNSPPRPMALNSSTMDTGMPYMSFPRTCEPTPVTHTLEMSESSNPVSSRYSPKAPYIEALGLLALTMRGAAMTPSRKPTIFVVLPPTSMPKTVSMIALPKNGFSHFIYYNSHRGQNQIKPGFFVRRGGKPPPLLPRREKSVVFLRFLSYTKEKHRKAWTKLKW